MECSTDWHELQGEDPEGSLSWFMVHRTREGDDEGIHEATDWGITTLGDFLGYIGICNIM